MMGKAMQGTEQMLGMNDMKTLADAKFAFENDEVKRAYLGVVAKFIAKQFKSSHYPDTVFDYPFAGVPHELAHPIIELHIRIPAAGCLPKSLVPALGHIPRRDEVRAIFSNCPAIENIQLRPEFQRYGFLNSLLRELVVLDTPYANISNIENTKLAEHYFKLSQDAKSGVELTSIPDSGLRMSANPTFAIDLRKKFGL